MKNALLSCIATSIIFLSFVSATQASLIDINDSLVRDDGSNGAIWYRSALTTYQDILDLQVTGDINDDGINDTVRFKWATNIQASALIDNNFLNRPVDPGIAFDDPAFDLNDPFYTFSPFNIEEKAERVDFLTHFYPNIVTADINEFIGRTGSALSYETDPISATGLAVFQYTNNDWGTATITGSVGLGYIAVVDLRSSTLGTPGTGTSPVPEPATMMLFGIGLLGLAGVNRRKK